MNKNFCSIHYQTPCSCTIRREVYLGALFPFHRVKWLQWAVSSTELCRRVEQNRSLQLNFSVLLTTQMSQCQLYLWGEMGSPAVFSAFSSKIRTLVELLDFPMGYFFHRLRWGDLYMERSDPKFQVPNLPWLIVHPYPPHYAIFGRTWGSFQKLS